MTDINNYLVTNIEFKELRPAMRVPVDAAGIQKILQSAYHGVSDEKALLIYVRSYLFFKYTVSFNYQVIGELPYVEPDWQEFYADVADMKLTDSKIQPLTVVMPQHFVASIRDDNMPLTDTIRHSIFEHLLHFLPIDITLH